MFLFRPGEITASAASSAVRSSVSVSRVVISFGNVIMSALFYLCSPEQGARLVENIFRSSRAASNPV